MIDLNDDINLSGLGDSIRNNYGNQKSTRLLKNLDAKIEDYLIINHYGDTIIVDTSLTINKFHKINYLRKDNFELLPFSNTGHTYNNLSYNSGTTYNGSAALTINAESPSIVGIWSSGSANGYAYILGLGTSSNNVVTYTNYRTASGSSWLTGSGSVSWSEHAYGNTTNLVTS